MPETNNKDILAEVNETIKERQNESQVVIIEFSLGKNLFGIEMVMVQEVIRTPDSFIAVPEVHSSIEGVIRLREQIIPVVNLNKYLQLGNSYTIEDSRIIIAQKEEELCGFWVNKVNQIHRLQSVQLESPPELVSSGKGYVTGVVKIGERVIFVIDFQRVCEDLMNQEDFQQMSNHLSASIEEMEKKS